MPLQQSYASPLVHHPRERTTSQYEETGYAVNTSSLDVLDASGSAGLGYGQRQNPGTLPPHAVIHSLTDPIDYQRRDSMESYGHDTDSPGRHSYSEMESEQTFSHSSTASRSIPRYHSRRKPFNQDEFDGPTQLLKPPSPRTVAGRERQLPPPPIHLTAQEQDEILSALNEILSACAYHFIAKYNFPIPLDRERQRVEYATDRDWNEWAYLLKRLATKRRIPARFLNDGQIKALVPTIENAIAPRASAPATTPGHARTQPGRVDSAKSHQATVTLKDDRAVLQHISAGIQVAKLLMDAVAMEQLDNLYVRSEGLILERRRMTSTRMTGTGVGTW